MKPGDLIKLKYKSKINLFYIQPEIGIIVSVDPCNRSYIKILFNNGICDYFQKSFIKEDYNVI